MIRCGDEQDGRKIAKAAGLHFNPECDRVIANVKGDELLGGVIFQAFTGSSFCVHMAGFDDHWATRDLLWSVFYYAFVHCGCSSLFGQVPDYKEDVLAINARLGFKEVTRIPDVFPDGGLVVMQMRKEDCKWLAVRPRAEHLAKITP